MAFSLSSITATENVIHDLADRPQLTSTQLKDKFDQMGEELKTQINTNIVTAVNGAIATSVTASDDKLPTANAVKTYVDAKIVEAGAGDMTKSAYDTTSTGNKVDTALVAESLSESAIASLKLAMYPVGAVYTSVVSTDPGTLFGGTWQRIGEGKVLVGVNTQDSDFNAAELTGGSKTVTLTSSQMPAHTHSVVGNTGTANTDHTHTYSGSTNSTGAHTHNMYISQGVTQYTTIAGSTGYDYGVFKMDASNSIWAGSNGNHTHTYSGSTGNQSSNHLHDFSITSGSAGGGTAHSNMQPYYTVYMWKRTA